MTNHTFAILGALLDFPELLSEPDVGEALSILEGDVALAVAAVRETRPKASLEVLSRLPSSLRGFAAGRMAAPRFEHAEDAKKEILDSAQALMIEAITAEATRRTAAKHRATWVS